MRVVVYKSEEPLSADEAFIAFLTGPTAIYQNRKRVGTGIGLLPVTFRSETADGAKNKAIAFWDEETGKKEAKIERGRELGRRRAKS